jgi:SAM-dependent methyltransferase
MVDISIKTFTRYLTRTLELYRGNLKTSGLTGLFRLTAAIGLCVAAPLYSRTGFTKRYCPACGWKGANFLPFLATGYVSFQVRCPQCQCASRHRAHQIFYEKHLRLMEKQGRLLYFAPESNVEKIRKNTKLEVKTSNYMEDTADYDIDIMHIPFEDNTWDYIICHRVIEHIPDDELGMRELYRILKPSGTLILSVPIDSTLEKTIAYGSPNPLENDHYYNYAPDFADRIPEQFKVTTYTFSHLFSAKEFKEMSLIEDYLFICEKT